MRSVTILLAMFASVAAIFYGVTAVSLGTANPLEWPMPILSVVVLAAVFSAVLLASLCEASAWASDHYTGDDDVAR
jgi:uncharacterized membrane protein HdeD (DUF308 family)